MSWFKGLFGGKSDGSPSLGHLRDREYDQLFRQVLQGVAANWDEQRLLKLLGDRCGDQQMVVWLRGYGDRLLSEPANPDLAGLLVRLGAIGCEELGVVAQEIGLEMRNMPVEQVVSEFEPMEVDAVQNSDAEMLYQKGLVELQANRYQEALEYFDCAVSINPDYDKAWNRKGLVLANLGRYEECIVSFGESARLKPDDDIAWYGKGLALENLGKYEDAIICYEYIISINSPIQI